MEKLQVWFSLIGSVITFIGVIILVYRTFTNPDIKAASEIKVIKSQCELKHKYIDENLILIKENHLAHLEVDMSVVKQNITRILTILEERNK